VLRGQGEGERPTEIALQLEVDPSGAAQGICNVISEVPAKAFVARGELHEGTLRLSLAGLDGASGGDLRADGQGETLRGQLRLNDRETTLTLAPVRPDQDAPPPPPSANAHDVPVHVHYDVEVDNRTFTFFNFTVLPIPIGTWQGDRIWHDSQGTVTVLWLPLRGPNASGQLLFTVKTWWQIDVAYFYINRWDVEDNVKVPITNDSTAWWNDRWENVRNGWIRMHRD
jgi:hypothetical protein